MALVDIPTARAHLRVDADYPESQLALYLGAATEQAQQFMNRMVYENTNALTDAVLDGTAGDDPMLINDSIRAAILLILGHLHANREDVVGGAAVVALPMGSRSLLQPFRVGMGV